MRNTEPKCALWKSSPIDVLQSALWVALGVLPKSFSYAVDCIARNNVESGGIAMKSEVYNELQKQTKGNPPLFMCCVFKQSDAITQLLKVRVLRATRGACDITEHRHCYMGFLVHTTTNCVRECRCQSVGHRACCCVVELSYFWLLCHSLHG